MKYSMNFRSRVSKSSKDLNDPRLSSFRTRMENQISAGLSHDAWVGGNTNRIHWDLSSRNAFRVFIFFRMPYLPFTPGTLVESIFGVVFIEPNYEVFPRVVPHLNLCREDPKRRLVLRFMAFRFLRVDDQRHHRFALLHGQGQSGCIPTPVGRVGLDGSSILAIQRCRARSSRAVIAGITFK